MSCNPDEGEFGPNRTGNPAQNGESCSERNPAQDGESCSDEGDFGPRTESCSGRVVIVQLGIQFHVCEEKPKRFHSINVKNPRLHGKGDGAVVTKIQLIPAYERLELPGGGRWTSALLARERDHPTGRASQPRRAPSVHFRVPTPEAKRKRPQPQPPQQPQEEKITTMTTTTTATTAATTTAAATKKSQQPPQPTKQITTITTGTTATGAAPKQITPITLFCLKRRLSPLFLTLLRR